MASAHGPSPKESPAGGAERRSSVARAETETVRRSEIPEGAGLIAQPLEVTGRTFGGDPKRIGRIAPLEETLTFRGQTGSRIGRPQLRNLFIVAQAKDSFGMDWNGKQ